jgi:hypothetical protein
VESRATKFPSGAAPIFSTAIGLILLVPPLTTLIRLLSGFISSRCAPPVNPVEVLNYEWCNQKSDEPMSPDGRILARSHVTEAICHWTSRRDDNAFVGVRILMSNNADKLDYLMVK